MNKYKVLLCDDEPEVIEAIIERLDWDGMGYEIPVHAKNGVEALEKCEELKPDVIMTDINMPYKNGLELAKEVKRSYPNTKIIIFSGYDDFEYAKEAIHLSCEEYILKPIDREELKKVFERIHGILDQEKDERTNVLKLEAYYKASLPALQESFLSTLMEGNVPEDDFEDCLVNYDLHFKGPQYVVCVIHTSTRKIPEDMTPMLCALSVRKLAEEQCRKNSEVFFTYLGNTCAIASVENEKQVRQLTDDMDRFARLVYTSMKIVVTVGVGQVVDSVAQLPVSYAGARKAVSYRVLYGTIKAINIEEVSPLEKEEAKDIEDIDLLDVFKKIRLNDSDELKEAVHTFIETSHSHMETMQDYRFFVMDIMTALYRFAKNNHLSTSELFTGSEDIYQYASRIEKRDLEDSLLNQCKILQTLLNESRNTTTRSFVTKAKEYANDNYSDETLSVETICRELGVSAAYFSTVFKKETGQAFIQYLTDIRMQKAAELLCEKDMKTYLIAKKVGYSDPNYFSYVFKKKFGVSPSKYKTGENA